MKEKSFLQGCLCLIRYLWRDKNKDWCMLPCFDCKMQCHSPVPSLPQTESLSKRLKHWPQWWVKNLGLVFITNALSCNHKSNTSVHCYRLCVILICSTVRSWWPRAGRKDGYRSHTPLPLLLSEKHWLLVASVMKKDRRLLL